MHGHNIYGIYLVKRKCAFWGGESDTSNIRPSAIRPSATRITGGHKKGKNSILLHSMAAQYGFLRLLQNQAKVEN
jgi:hypothetical protein